MDGGVKQEEMAEKLKTEIKEMAHRRRGERIGHVLDAQRPSVTAVAAQEVLGPVRDSSGPLETTEIHSNGTGPSSKSPTSEPQRGADCTLIKKDACTKISFERSDTILLAFYLENLLPFLFPFYRPSLLEGGRAWIFELMISSPVVRQATLCQSLYFFSLARGSADHNEVWAQVLTQTTDALGILRQALQVIEGSGVEEHLHGAVRIMASIMQMQRFEIAVSSFHNWQNHLNAALALFEQLLHSATGPREIAACFEDVVNRLGSSSSSSWTRPSETGQIPSAEQAAFRFSSTVIIFDDVIASTALGEQPKLYGYHQSLLSCQKGIYVAPIDLESVVGLNNETLLCIGEISALQAWKQGCKVVGNVDVVELVYRGTTIKESLVAQLIRLETGSQPGTRKSGSLLDNFTPLLSQSSSVSRVWAHAALIYLSTVASGWQPDNDEVRYHISRVIELLQSQDSPTVLRTMVWPFCVAGCLAEPAQEASFRGLVNNLQPASIFGTLHKSLEIMENVWRTKEKGLLDRDLAMCFRLQDEVILLV